MVWIRLHRKLGAKHQTPNLELKETRVTHFYVFFPQMLAVGPMTNVIFPVHAHFRIQDLRAIKCPLMQLDI